MTRGDLTPECAAALTAVLQELGKRRGPQADRNEGQRFHDALAEACALVLRASGPIRWVLSNWKVGAPAHYRSRGDTAAVVARSRRGWLSAA